MMSGQSHRRAFLRGAGALLSLPFLESLPGFVSAEPARPPVRTAFLYFPNGAWMPGWVPKQIGSEFELPFSLTPLADLRSEILVLSGLDKAQSRGGDGHYAKTANLLTGLKITKTTGKDIHAGGISVDQYIASRIGHLTPLPSLELGIDPVISGIDSNVGYTRLYGSHISWRTPTIPVAKEINPRLVFDRLFGRTESGKSDDDRSLLDLTLEDARSLRGKLGRDDQFKLDEYLDSIRAVEKRLEFSAREGEKSPRPAIPANQLVRPGEQIPKDFREHVKLMLDLMVLAFWSDSTRVISFMFANDVSGKNFSFLDGVKASHHDTSHHANEKDKIEQYQRIVRWHVAQFAYLLKRLKDVKEGAGTLLDNSMILCGSSFSDGNAHDPNNLPILLGGRAGGTLATGRHLPGKRAPLCNLYVSMLERMGTPLKTFGDSDGPLAGL